jgi:hypothetical protein
MAVNAGTVRWMGWRWYSPRSGSVNSGPLRFSGFGGPGLSPGEVEVLAFGSVIEDVQEAVDLGGRGEFLAQFAGQRGF